MKLCFFYPAFFLSDHKNENKKLIILNTKTAFKVKQKAFFIVFNEGFQLPEIDSDPGVGL